MRACTTNKWIATAGHAPSHAQFLVPPEHLITNPPSHAEETDRQPQQQRHHGRCTCKSRSRQAAATACTSSTPSPTPTQAVGCAAAGPPLLHNATGFPGLSGDREQQGVAGCRQHHPCPAGKPFSACAWAYQLHASYAEAHALCKPGGKAGSKQAVPASDGQHWDAVPKPQMLKPEIRPVGHNPLHGATASLWGSAAAWPPLPGVCPGCSRSTQVPCLAGRPCLAMQVGRDLKPSHSPGLRYHHLPANDYPWQDLRQFFAEAFEFIEQARQGTGWWEGGWGLRAHGAVTWAHP